MNKTHVTIYKETYGLTDFVYSIPNRFPNEGQVLFKSRNDIRLMEHDGQRMAVKRFAHPNLMKRISRILGHGKARAAYSNAIELVNRGIPTPSPIALIEVMNSAGLMDDSYYVCEYTALPPIVDGLKEDGEFDVEMTQAFARFVATLHSKGVLHHDLNSTNVRYSHGDSGYNFTLIDINRMTFRNPSVGISLDECLLNITRFSGCSAMFRCFVAEYLSARQLNAALLDKAMRVKTRHDRQYKLKKKIGGLFRKRC